MRILLLANLKSIHTKRWANSLIEKRVDVSIFDFFNNEYTASEYNKGIKIFTFNIDNRFSDRKEGGFLKITYLKSIFYLKKVIKDLKPDIIHSHYASSYGLIGAFCKVSPFIVSVWGSDIFSFPRKSIFHKVVIKFVLKQADIILSTSNTMAIEIKKYVNKDIKITPFGVNLHKFRPIIINNNIFNNNDIVIGTVKTLSYNYGIEYLIRAFNILYNKYPELPLKLLIVGEGPLRKQLENLVKELNIENKTVFAGKVDHKDIPLYFNMLSIPVFLSHNESFGVSVIEASACAKPVVVSDVGGMPEVVEKGVTGMIVPPMNPEKAAEAIEKFVLNKKLRNKIGKAGRERVKKMYNWDDCVDKMVDIYNNILYRE